MTTTNIPGAPDYSRSNRLLPVILLSLPMAVAILSIASIVAEIGHDGESGGVS